MPDMENIVADMRAAVRNAPLGVLSIEPFIRRIQAVLRAQAQAEPVGAVTEQCPDCNKPAVSTIAGAPIVNGDNTRPDGLAPIATAIVDALRAITTVHSDPERQRRYEIETVAAAIAAGDGEWVRYSDYAALVSQVEDMKRRRDALKSAMEDLVSWLPDEPSRPEWRLKAGKHGADDAIEAARTALAGEDGR